MADDYVVKSFDPELLRVRMRALLRRAQRPLQAELLHGIGDGRREVGEDALRAHMRNLRQTLTAAGCHPNLIETVYGVGYRLHPAACS